jgi:predicted signal transduction protein with EAL and GGDEF domain
MIAEGIETELQFRRLVELGCEKGQGYLLAGPMPAPEVDSIVRSECRSHSRNERRLAQSIERFAPPQESASIRA